MSNEERSKTPYGDFVKLIKLLDELGKMDDGPHKDSLQKQVVLVTRRLVDATPKVPCAVRIPALHTLIVFEEESVDGDDGLALGVWDYVDADEVKWPGRSDVQSNEVKPAQYLNKIATNLSRAYLLAASVRDNETEWLSVGSDYERFVDNAERSAAKFWTWVDAKDEKRVMVWCKDVGAMITLANENDNDPSDVKARLIHFVDASVLLWKDDSIGRK